MIDLETALTRAYHDASHGIGSLGEKTLHLCLKYLFAPDADTHEQSLGGYIADAVTEAGVVEIQTRGLYRLRKKLETFLPYCPVTVVHPVRVKTRIITMNDGGEVTACRVSPKHESAVSVMREVARLPVSLLMQDGFTLCLCEVEVTEYRVRNGKAKPVKLDTVPEKLLQMRWFRCAMDYADLLPDGLPEQFTATDLQQKCHVPIDTCRGFIRLLAGMDVLAEAGRAGRMKQWRRVDFVSGAIRR